MIIVQQSSIYCPTDLNKNLSNARLGGTSDRTPKNEPFFFYEDDFLFTTIDITIVLVLVELYYCQISFCYYCCTTAYAVELYLLSFSVLCITTIILYYCALIDLYRRELLCSCFGAHTFSRQGKKSQIACLGMPNVHRV